MKKEWLLLLVSVVVTVAIGIGMIRWLAPELLGIRTDLRLVQVDKKVPPFYDNIFREEDFQPSGFLINDPSTKIRAKPLFPIFGQGGPHDLLGFRNRSIPNTADLVVIGDSQTYGNNIMMDHNWPSQMQTNLAHKEVSVYSMATGGLGSVQYLDMLSKGMVFQPRVVVIAFYSGNDPMESLQMAYGVEKWHFLQSGPKPSSKGHLTTESPPPKSEQWPVEFSDGIKTIFTPKLRLVSNQDHPVVKTGYKIMANAAKRISELAKPNSIQLVFTVIPTKELVYAQKVKKEGIVPPLEYLTLIKTEGQNIKNLADSIRGLPNAVYVDMVEPLQKAALDSNYLYPQSENGHPIGRGYGVIAKAMGDQVVQYLPAPPKGLVALQVGRQKYKMLVVSQKGIWEFASNRLVIANGWRADKAYSIRRRDIAGLRWLGKIREVDPKRFGPAVLQ